MARSTPIIAAAGVGLLAAAVATVAIRGADDGTPSDDMTTPAATSPDATETFPTDAETTEDLPTETTAPTETETDGTGNGAGEGDPTDGATDDATDGATDDATDDATDGATDDGDDDGDPTAVGPTSETPETGGGALTALGGMVAAGAAVAGRRRTR